MNLGNEQVNQKTTAIFLGILTFLGLVTAAVITYKASTDTVLVSIHATETAEARLILLAPKNTMSPIPIAISSASTPSATSTLAPSPTWTASATALRTLTRTPSPSSTALPCPVNYLVQYADTLTSISARFGVQVAEIQAANNLVGDRIDAGQKLVIPCPGVFAAQAAQISPIPRLPPIMTPSPAQSVNSSCPYPEAQLTYPPMNGNLRRGVVGITGTASRIDFIFYKIQEHPSGNELWTEIYQSKSPVVNGILMKWDTTALDVGDHWLRLLVTDSSGQYAECVVKFRLN